MARLAAYTGASQWITGEAARRHVHTQRGRYRSILVGVGTVLADDPQLTCRMEGGRNPLRLVCDTHLRTPLHRPGGKDRRGDPHLPGHLRHPGGAAGPLPGPGGPDSPPAPGGRRPRGPGRPGAPCWGRWGWTASWPEGGAQLHWGLVQAGLVQQGPGLSGSQAPGGAGGQVPGGGPGLSPPGPGPLPLASAYPHPSGGGHSAWKAR